MKQIFILVASLVFFNMGLSAQHRGDNWILGHCSPSVDTFLEALMQLDFQQQPYSISKFKSYHRIWPGQANAVISSEDGEIQLFSDGYNVYNSEIQIIDNGANLPASSTFSPGTQGGLFLPYPDKRDSIIFLTGDKFAFDWQGNFVGGQRNFTYSVIDMTANNGDARMVERKTVLIQDTLPAGMISAVKHANGRDWWTVVFQYDRNSYYPILFSPEGPNVYDIEYLSGFTKNSSGQAAFSPDGNWYARYNATGSPFEGYVDIYRFDRCTGLLSSPLNKKIGDGLDWGGIAFSPNSRFIYASAFDSIYQFDLEATDIFGSQTLVAVYDSFTHDIARYDSINIQVATRFYQMQTAPDGKIYISVPNTNSYYIHTIEKPNLKGVACEVKQHSINFPVPVDNAIPNMPNYNLGALVGSPCDSIATVHTEATLQKPRIEVYPNPTVGDLYFNIDGAQYPCRIRFYDELGRNVFEATLREGENRLSINTLPAGFYFYKIRNEASRQILKGKVLKTPRK